MIPISTSSRAVGEGNWRKTSLLQMNHQDFQAVYDRDRLDICHEVLWIQVLVNEFPYESYPKFGNWISL
jgi:hypothetical protein